MDRALSLDEIKVAFQVFRENSHIFTRVNFIVVTLLIMLGVLKGELIAAKWEEFDFTNNTWTLPKRESRQK